MTGAGEKRIAGRRNIARGSSPWNRLAAAVIKLAVADAGFEGARGDAALQWLERCRSGFYYDPAWELAGLSATAADGIVARAEARREKLRRAQVNRTIKAAVMAGRGRSSPPDAPCLKGMSLEEYRALYVNAYHRLYQEKRRRSPEAREKDSQRALAYYYRKKAESKEMKWYQDKPREGKNDKR